MKTLVIAEKPSVGRDIARVLGCPDKRGGALEGKNYIVTWALGHLVTLMDPEDYNKKYKEWRAQDLPIMPKQMKTKVIPQTARQYQEVRAALNRRDVGQVVIATDAGREGELVARWILEMAGNEKPLKRLWISSVTDKAIRDGFAHLQDAKRYEPLYHAAASRAEADWLVGINATRALTCKYNAQLSCGRVQTPTLAMIVRREEEIQKFQPKSYYGLQAKTGGAVLAWRSKAGSSMSSFDKAYMEGLITTLRGKPLRIEEVRKKEKAVPPPQLYDLTEVQREANRRFGFAAKKTLDILQRLYENYKVLTYPRTDSRYLTSDMTGTIQERLQACGAGPYRALAAPLLKKAWGGKQPFVSDAKVSDHHAIIPTEQYVRLADMSGDERKVYDLVVRRFLAVLYPPCRYEETAVTAKIAQESFVGKGSRILQEGWKAVYAGMQPWEEEYDEAEEDGADGSRGAYGNADGSGGFPDFREGQTIEGVCLRLTEGKTKPPARFTEASLLSAMENPVKFMDNRDRQMVKTMGETGGLGTVATRADIIEKLFSNFLLEKKGNEIYSTSKARQLLRLVPEDLKKPELTAQWEQKLGKIAKGELPAGDFLGEIRGYTRELLEEIQQEEGSFRHDNLTSKKCPVCGKHLLAVNGKQAKLLVCQDRNCGYRETVSRLTNARCPNCRKKMELTGKGEKAAFVCSCGYKERLSKFEERRQKEGAGIKKKDVQRYLRRQQEEAQEPLNTAFADALKKL